MKWINLVCPRVWPVRPSRTISLASSLWRYWSLLSRTTGSWPGGRLVVWKRPYALGARGSAVGTSTDGIERAERRSIVVIVRLTATLPAIAVTLAQSPPTSRPARSGKIARVVKGEEGASWIMPKTLLKFMDENGC